MPLYNPYARFVKRLEKYREYISRDLEPFFADAEIAVHRFESGGHAKRELFEYIEVFYNQRRRHSTIGDVSPSVFEQRALVGVKNERCA